MRNYGLNMGEGNNYSGKTKINNKTIVKKGKIVISVTIVLALVAVVVVILLNRKESIIGSWVTEDGERIEFLSDGTIHEEGYDSLNADTYEIMKEGYLKWGKYDASWIEYRYTYWDIDINGKHMTLTMRDNPDYYLKLTRD